MPRVRGDRAVWGRRVSGLLDLGFLHFLTSNLGLILAGDGVGDGCWRGGIACRWQSGLGLDLFSGDVTGEN